MFRQLTETEKKEATDFFLEKLLRKSKEEITEARKQNPKLFRNRCQTASSTEYYDERKKSLEGDRKEKYLSYERIKKAEIRKKHEEFIREHLIRKEDYGLAKYKIIKEDELSDWDVFISLAIPFDNIRYWVPKFWGGVEIYKNRSPELFERVKKTFEVFNGDTEIISNNAYYNTKVK